MVGFSQWACPTDSGELVDEYLIKSKNQHLWLISKCPHQNTGRTSFSNGMTRYDHLWSCLIIPFCRAWHVSTRTSKHCKTCRIPARSLPMRTDRMLDLSEEATLWNVQRLKRLKTNYDKLCARNIGGTRCIRSTYLQCQHLQVKNFERWNFKMQTCRGQISSKLWNATATNNLSWRRALKFSWIFSMAKTGLWWYDDIWLMHKRRYWIYSRLHRLYSTHCMCSVSVYMISHDVHTIRQRCKFSTACVWYKVSKRVASSRRNVLRVAPPTPWCVDFGGVVVQCFKEKKAQATQPVNENPEKHFEPII